MDTITKCYVEDQIRNHMLQFNPQNSINFSENNYKNLLCVSDRIQCCNRFVWNNLPSAFTTLDIETMLYSSGAICCFLDNDNLIFSPFSLVGDLDKKGNLHRVQPITLDGKALGSKKRPYTPTGRYEFDTDCCVIIKDYTGVIQTDKIIPRFILNSSTTINDEVKTYKVLLYNIILSIKKMIATCDNEEMVKSVINQAKILLDPTQPIVAITSGASLTDKIEITQFVDKVQVSDLTQAIDFYNKIRRLNNGIPAPDTFEKKERMITDELKNSTAFSNFILSDGLLNRQIAVENINKCFNQNINVEYNEILKEKEAEINNELQF